MSKLDQLVKGAPPPDIHLPTATANTPIPSIESQDLSNVSDPLASLPSSPPQIYLNLLILEASLRAQWLQLRARRRQHTFFLTILALWITYFGYALFFAPREDGSGVGGSVYWVVEVTEKVCFMGGIVTGILVWGTGQWERGVRWPRRWVGTTNRGLRGFNCKLVVMKESWWTASISFLSFLLSSGLFSGSRRSSYRYIDQALRVESETTTPSTSGNTLPNIHEEEDVAGWEEDLAPGGDYVKLLLLPKPFSPNFRENWETYRTEYWERENERRATMRKRLAEHEWRLAKQQGGWFWWWRGYRGQASRDSDIEKRHHRTGNTAPLINRHNSLEKDGHRRGKSASLRSGSHSRTSSRSATPTDFDEPLGSGHHRTGSTSSTGSERRKKRGTRSSVIGPMARSPLAREGSIASVSSIETDNPFTPGASDGDGGESTRSTSPAPK